MPAYLLVRTGPSAGARHELASELTLGSAPDADLRFDSPALSERHGVFRSTPEGVHFEALPGRIRSTLMRGGLGRVLEPGGGEPVALEPGDRILVGYGADRVELELEVDPEPEAPGGELRSVSSSALVEEERSRIVRARLAIEGARTLDARLGAEDAGALSRIYRLVRALGRPAGSVAELATRVTEEILGLSPTVTHITLFLTQPEPPHALEPVHMRQSRSLPEGAREEHIVSRTLLDHVCQQREAVLFSDAGDTFSESTSVRAGDIRSTVCVPLFFDERLVGVLQLDNRHSPLAFDERDLEIFTIFGQQLAAALENVTLRERLERAERQLTSENAALRASLETTLVAESRRMREVYRSIEQVARERLSVMICGETGTGKELVAQTLHALSRRQGRFVAVNCAAIPKDLIESELFGHVRGAFTGASGPKAGLFLAADGGTLFLDEVTELPYEFQAKLLRAVENGEVRAVGSDRSRSVDVRFVAATNRDPEAEVKGGRFREDLFYRLNVLRIDVPPLRERFEDVPALAEHLLARYCAEAGRRIPGFSPKALGLLLSHSWPGNVRELRNEVERAAVKTEEGKPIAATALSAGIGGGADAAGEEDGGGGPLKDVVEAVERRIIRDALARFGGNLSHAAEYLNLSRPGLRMKIKRYGIPRDPDPDES